MENGVIDFLRDRSEENLDDVLKSSMGGYTRKSVQDYVTQLRRQQQAAGKRFNEEMKNVLAEKESLKEELNRVKVSLSQKEAQYRALSESLEEYRQAEGESSAENIVEMKRQIAKQDDTITALESEKKLLEQKKGQAEKRAEGLKKELEQSIQEHALTKDILLEEKKKTVQTLKQVQELSSQLTLAQDELAYLREQTSEGTTAVLKEKVSKLQDELKTQQELLEQRKNELEVKEQQIQAGIRQSDMKSGQIKMLEEKAEKLQRTVELVSVQNQKLEAYQRELTKKLQKAFKENLEILQAKSELQIENLKLSKKSE